MTTHNHPSCVVLLCRFPISLSSTTARQARASPCLRTRRNDFRNIAWFIHLAQYSQRDRTATMISFFLRIQRMKQLNVWSGETILHLVSICLRFLSASAPHENFPLCGLSEVKRFQYIQNMCNTCTAFVLHTYGLCVAEGKNIDLSGVSGPTQYSTPQSHTHTRRTHADQTIK